MSSSATDAVTRSCTCSFSSPIRAERRRNATALARVTSIQLLNAKDYRANPRFKIRATPKPFVGKTARLHLRNGVITEPLDGFNTIYCGAKAEAKGVCGA